MCVIHRKFVGLSRSAKQITMVMETKFSHMAALRNNVIIFLIIVTLVFYINSMLRFAVLDSSQAENERKSRIAK